MVENHIDWTLIQKSIDGNLTQEEETLLNEWLSQSEKHKEFYYSATRKGKSDPVEGLKPEELQIQKERLFSKIAVTQSSAKTVLSGKQSGNQALKASIIRKKWLVAATIALPFLLGSLFLFLSYNHSFTFKTAISKLEVIDKVENLSPGSNKAILILEDGRRVALGQENTVIKEGATQIISQNHQLQYNTNRVDSNLINQEVDSVENFDREEKIVKNRLLIPRGGEFVLKLSDGTKVWLNSETYIEYPVKFIGETREVTIVGEAYLEVAKNDKVPFIVKTEDFNVRVVGTSFNINSYREMDNSNITVETGKVDVIRPSGKTTRVEVNQQLTVNRLTNEQTLERVDPSVALAWKDGYFYFDKESLEKIAKQLGRWYDAEISISSLHLAKIRFSGKVLKYQNASEVLDMLTLTGELQYAISKGQIEISPKKN